MVKVLLSTAFHAGSSSLVAGRDAWLLDTVLQEQIVLARGSSVMRTLDEIVGRLVCLPHPCLRLRGD